MMQIKPDRQSDAAKGKADLFPSALALAGAADEASRLLRAMGHGGRLKILCLLLSGERSSGEIARAIGLKEPAASQQLAQLKMKRLVEARREGQRILYRVEDPAAVRILAVLHDIYCSSDEAFRDDPSPPAIRSTPSNRPTRASARR